MIITLVFCCKFYLIQKAMNIDLLKTNKDFENALKRMELLFNAQSGTPESDEADED